MKYESAKMRLMLVLIIKMSSDTCQDFSFNFNNMINNSNKFDTPEMPLMLSMTKSDMSLLSYFLGIPAMLLFRAGGI